MLAAFYMALNAARFGNPFEFGHNYLPEYMRNEAGQFSLRYLSDHVKEILRLPQTGGSGGALRFFTYDCMAFWLISPLLVTFLLAWLYALLRRKGCLRMERFGLPVMVMTHLLIVLCHSTLGGWQFGNRYLLDMMPWLLYGLLALAPEEDGFWHLNIPLACMGLAVNLIGTAAAYNHWI